MKTDEMHIPLDLQNKEGRYYIVFAVLPKQNFTDPFFVDSLLHKFNLATVNKISPKEQNKLVRPLHYNDDARLEYIPLKTFMGSFLDKHLLKDKLKFIFHMSRCGSTLVTQMLATSERFFVISELPIITLLLDPLLILPDGESESQSLLSVGHSRRKESLRFLLE